MKQITKSRITRRNSLVDVLTQLGKRCTDVMLTMEEGSPFILVSTSTKLYAAIASIKISYQVSLAGSPRDTDSTQSVVVSVKEFKQLLKDQEAEIELYLERQEGALNPTHLCIRGLGYNPEPARLAVSSPELYPQLRAKEPSPRQKTILDATYRISRQSFFTAIQAASSVLGDDPTNSILIQYQGRQWRILFTNKNGVTEVVSHGDIHEDSEVKQHSILKDEVLLLRDLMKLQRDPQAIISGGWGGDREVRLFGDYKTLPIHIVIEFTCGYKVLPIPDLKNR